MKVFAPATIANLAVGYDILGLAIYGPGDEIKFLEGEEQGIKIIGIHGDNRKLPRKVEHNTAGYAAQKVLEASGIKDVAVEMEIFKKMPFGSGMGSSAASAVAGAIGMNYFLGEPFSKSEILRSAVEGEQIADGAFHADNVAPSLFGGITLIRNNAELDVIRLPVPLGMYAILIYPHVKLLTKDSRDILKENISLKNHVLQSGNLAAFIASLYRSDIDLMQRSFKDLIIEPQRTALIPRFSEIKTIVEAHDIIGFSISGAGPSMFALCMNSFTADNIKTQIENLYKNNKEEVEVFVSKINTQGAYKC